MEDGFFYSFLYFIVSSFFLIFLMKVVVHDFWWIPTRIENHFMQQGINSPRYEYFLGNLREISILSLKASSESMPLSHDIFPRALSFIHLWKKIYGMYSFFFSFVWLFVLLVVCFSASLVLLVICLALVISSWPFVFHNKWFFLVCFTGLCVFFARFVLFMSWSFS